MKFGSLFSGIGGMDLGLERAGMECVWQVEIEPFCQRVLSKHWPDVQKYEDIQDVESDMLAPVDLICGGFPCPPVSNANPEKKGADDERWLWPEFRRIVRDTLPEWVLVENVPGLRSTWDGRLFGGILRDLADCGYDAEWESISAKAIGAPHLRWRVFIVAHSERVGRAKRTAKFERSGDRRPSNFVSNAGETSPSVADTTRSRRNGRENLEGKGSPKRGGTGVSRQAVSEGDADAEDSRGTLEGRRSDLLLQDTDREGLERTPWEGVQIGRGIGVFAGAGDVRPRRDWAVEPPVGRVAHGIPSRVDRLIGLGNAVVPQIAEWIGERILYVENEFDQHYLTLTEE